MGMFKTGDFGKGNKFVGLANYQKVFGDEEVWQSLWNTVKYAIAEVPISIAIALVLAVFLNKKLKGREVFRTIMFLPMIVAPAAIAMVWKWLYNSNFGLINNMFGIVLFQMMIPVQIFIIPQYVMVSKLHLTNSAMGLLFPGLVSAFGTFLLRQAYMGLPKDLEEAARLDGCNIPQTFLFVMAPLAKSSMVALGIFTAVFAYKDLMWPMIVCPKPAKTTLAAALANMSGQYSQKYPELMMAALISCVPMIILYIIFQKQFIEGIATSGGKL